MSDTPPYDFFISRQGEQEEEATKLKDLLRAQGYSVAIQDDFRNQAFFELMGEWMGQSGKLIALLSPSYLASEMCRLELAAFQKPDPFNKQERIIPLNVLDHESHPIIGQLVWTDTRGLWDDMDKLGPQLLHAIDPQRFAKPATSLAQELSPAAINTGYLAQPPQHFVGREAYLAELHAKLNQTDRVAVVAGFGGVGKTSVARAYAWAHREAYQAIWWLNAETFTNDVLGQAGELIESLGNLPPDEQVKAAFEQVEKRGQEGRPYLLIIDNVESEKTLPQGLPILGNKRLVTSRSEVWLNAEALTLDSWSPDVAQAYILSQLPGSKAKDAAELAEGLGYLPLAIEQACAYCRIMGKPLAEYKADFLGYAQKLEAKPELLAGVLPNERPVWGTTGLMIQNLIDQNQDHALKLLSYLAFAPATGLPREFVASYLMPQDDALDEASGALMQASMLYRRHDGKGQIDLSIHRLTRDVARQHFKAQESDLVKELWLALENADHERPSGFKTWDHRSWPFFRRLEPLFSQLQSGLSQAPYPDWLKSRLWSHFGLVFSYQGRFDEAENWYKTAVEVSRAREGEKSPGHSTCLSNLATLYQDQNRLDEAEQLLSQAKTVQEEILEPHDPSLAITLNNLASVLEYQGKLDQAEPLYRQALDIDEKNLPPNHPDLAIDYSNLAGLLQTQKKFDQALPLYKKTLEIFRKHYGQNHALVAQILNNLAALHSHMQDFDLALPLSAQAVAMGLATIGDQHPNTQLWIKNHEIRLTNAGKSPAEVEASWAQIHSEAARIQAEEEAEED